MGEPYRTTSEERAEKIGEILLRALPEMTDEQFARFCAALPNSSVPDAVQEIAFQVSEGS